TMVEVTAAVRALDHLDLGDRHELYLGLRAIFVTRPAELPPFDRRFDAFWRIVPDGDDSSGFIPAPAIEDPTGASVVKSDQKRDALALDSWGEEEAEEAGDPLSVPLASEAEALVHQDLSTFGADQLDDLLKLTAKIHTPPDHLLRRPAERRCHLDVPRTLHANLTKGDRIDLRFRERKRKKVRLVLLCDVAGSMDLYSRFLLQFLFALQNVFGRVETFIFSTRLTRVSEYLRGRSYRQVLRRLTDVRDWSGWTRIGESLAQFNREWPHLVDRRTIVIILSDGWDTGEPE